MTEMHGRSILRAGLMEDVEGAIGGCGDTQALVVYSFD